MIAERIPIIILGGSDRRSVELPDSGRDKHPISGCKGVDILIDGRPMVESVVRRLDASGHFGPIYVAGPSRAYRQVSSAARLIDTDGSFGENIRVSMEAVRAAHPGLPVGFITCDVLPDTALLSGLMEEYRRQAPCDLWFPLIRAPEDSSELGEFSWKPVYRIAPGEGEPALRLLPGHLVVVDPDALRLDFLYRLFQIGYRTRNRPINRRRAAMVRGVFLELLYQDLLHVLGLRLPTLTWGVLSSGIRAATALRKGTITRARLEGAMRRIFVRDRHRRRHPERRILVPLVEGLSLALDIDTEEEAREIGGETAVLSN
jgi:hypothetical protein